MPITLHAFCMGRSLGTRLGSTYYIPCFLCGEEPGYEARRYLQHPSQGQVCNATDTHGATAAQWERKTLVLSLEQLPHIED